LFRTLPTRSRFTGQVFNASSEQGTSIAFNSSGVAGSSPSHFGQSLSALFDPLADFNNLQGIGLWVRFEAKRVAAELAARESAEQAEREGVLKAEQKAARDARYAARKAAKKERRRGY